MQASTERLLCAVHEIANIGNRKTQGIKTTNIGIAIKGCFLSMPLLGGEIRGHYSKCVVHDCKVSVSY